MAPLREAAPPPCASAHLGEPGVADGVRDEAGRLSGPLQSLPDRRSAL
jgi:hypothetical protein